jgi:3-isopropylmalate/(R)-2-methylmalate dehydratase large subunit
MLYVDLHLVHEVTSPQAFSELRERGLSAASSRSDAGHAGSFHADACRRTPMATSVCERRGAGAGDQLETNCREFGVELHGWDSETAASCT